MRISKIVIKPVLTEKSMALEADSKYVFRVEPKASKGAIKDEMKRLYDVDVTEVRTMVMPGKKRRITGTRNFTKTKSWKKAIVKVKEGQKIEFLGK
jgi:large subunit ribosomal protein L23